MKTFTRTLLALGLVWTVAGCSSSSPTADEKPQPLEELALGKEPSWPKPAARFDGVPVVLRAVRTNGHVVLWGYGTGGPILDADARYYDDNDVIVGTNHLSGGFRAVPDKWYRVASLDPMDEGLTFTKVLAQVNALRPGGGAPASWAADRVYGYGTSWRRPSPKTPTHKLAEFPIAFSPVAVDAFAAAKYGSKTPHVETIVAVYNLGDKPIERAEVEVTYSDAAGVIDMLHGAWVPTVGSDPIPSIPPSGWSLIALESAKADPTRMKSATKVDFKLTQVEGPGITFKPAK